MICLGAAYFCYLSPFNVFFFFFILSVPLLSILHRTAGHSASLAFSHATSRQQQKAKALSLTGLRDPCLSFPGCSAARIAPAR